MPPASQGYLEKNAMYAPGEVFLFSAYCGHGGESLRLFVPIRVVFFVAPARIVRKT